MYSRWLRNSFIYLLILVAAIAIGFAFFSGGDDKDTIAYGEFVADAEAGKIEKVSVDGDKLEATYRDAGTCDYRTSANCGTYPIVHADTGKDRGRSTCPTTRQWHHKSAGDRHRRAAGGDRHRYHAHSIVEPDQRQPDHAIGVWESTASPGSAFAWAASCFR